MNEINPEMLKALKGLEASGCRITGGKLKTEYDAKKGDSHTPESREDYNPDQPRINDKCPACGWKTLFIGAGGWLTCGNIDCPEPATSDAITAAIRASNKTLLERLKSKQRTTYMYLQPDTPAVRVSDIDAELARLDQEGADNG